MYAIIFNFDFNTLKKHFNDDQNGHTIALLELTKELSNINFKCIQDGFFITTDESNPLSTLHKGINKLASIKWFKNSVIDLRAFKVENLSDFTDIVKNK